MRREGALISKLIFGLGLLGRELERRRKRFLPRCWGSHSILKDMRELVKKSTPQRELAFAIADLAEAISHLGDQVRTLETPTLARAIRDLAATLGKHTR
jgi:hypothetical protein